MEEVSGVPFEDFMRDNIFEPAGPQRTRIFHRRKNSLSPEKLAYGLVLDLSSGRYRLPDDSPEKDFRIEEILLKDGELYAVVSLRGIRHECRLYPMGENTFGIKVYSSELSFGEDSLTFWGKTGKKL